MRALRVKKAKKFHIFTKGTSCFPKNKFCKKKQNKIKWKILNTRCSVVKLVMFAQKSNSSFFILYKETSLLYCFSVPLPHCLMATLPFCPAVPLSTSPLPPFQCPSDTAPLLHYCPMPHCLTALLPKCPAASLRYCPFTSLPPLPHCCSVHCCTAPKPHWPEFSLPHSLTTSLYCITAC